jgi:peptide/nickel transport system permease protein
LDTTEPLHTKDRTNAADDRERGGQSYWQLVWWRFRRNRLGLTGGLVVLGFYLVCGVFAEFFSPYLLEHKSDYVKAPPQMLHLRDAEGRFHLRPFVYGYERKIDPEALRRFYVVDPSKMYPVYLFARGEPYKLFGLFDADIHFFGTGIDHPEAHWFLFGTDQLGRDLFSRIIYGGRVSLTVGLVGEILGLIAGTIFGGLSGYLGGIIDFAIQRAVELMMAFPTIPLWMALAAAIPPQWSPLTVWLALTVIISLIGSGGLARQVRGLVLSLREREFVLAAISAGADSWYVVTRHLLPNTLSHLIVTSTLAIPAMILGETSLSFLGLGLRPPITSWGVLLKETQNVLALRYTPWFVIPAAFVILSVLAFNFWGDGLRDAADPYAIDRSAPANE